MLKLIPPGSYADDMVVSLVKRASRGLRGKDRQDFIKVAGEEFAHRLDSLDLAEDEIPIHLNAMGSTESVGANRNGDGFKLAMLEKYHPTFVSHARWYHDHLNRDPSKSYGRVKLSACRRKMQRVELLVALNGSEKAASRNGGLMAIDELELLARGDEIPVSMAITVPYDVCSQCNNRARTRADYCDAPEFGGTCKAGGLRRNICRVLDDGTQLYADNTEGTFFDISKVKRGADRTAFVFGELRKAAANGVRLSGAELAEMIGLTQPYTLLEQSPLPAYVAQHLKVAHRLAAIGQSHGQSLAKLAGHPAARTPLELPLRPRSDLKLAHALGGLAAEHIVLPLVDFLRLLGIEDKQAAAVAADVQPCIPGMFDRLLNCADLEERITNNPYLPATPLPWAREWAAKQAAALSLDPEALTRRAALAALRGAAPTTTIVKAAAPSAPMQELAHHYALYQLAALASMPEALWSAGISQNCA